MDAGNVGPQAAAWEKVVRKLRPRYMPPAGLPRPDEKTYQTLVADLEVKLDTWQTGHANPGRTDTFRRLNRTEYRNAVRDLLAVDADVSSILPADESSHGFDNITVGNLSPTLLERYLTAAQKIARLAVGHASRQPGGDMVNLPPDLTQEEHFAGLPLGTRGGKVLRYNFPVDAEYEIQVRLARDRNEHIEGLVGTHDVEIAVDGERVGLFKVTQPPTGQDHSQADKHINARITMKAGPHLVAAAFPKKPSVLLETERQPYQAHFNMDRHPRITPAVYSVSINGPYGERHTSDTPSRRRLFVCRPAGTADEDACAEKVLTALMKRAYRRPVASEDLKASMRFYREGKKDYSFDNGIEMAVRAVLVSPEFIFRVEQDPAGASPGAAYRISDLELASRLSFFLWSSIPDDELLDLAIQGKLRAPGVLERQVARMLRDERSRSLITNFAGQWLQLRNLESITPDMRAFPDFDDNLRQSFRTETELLFESIVHEDRSVLDLLKANYTYVNGRLARHYGIPNVYGSRFRKIENVLGRGGLLRQGSILMVTSYATRTSPVIRGKWIMDNLLGVPPPPPPGNVPALKENGTGSKARTMRERLAQHRANPACAGCHALMDPPGFALENYDAVGRWREAEDGVNIDAAGGLPDGSKFEGVEGLQKALLARPELFVNTIAEKLLTYGLGRGVEYTDAPAVRKIVRQSAARDYKFSALIEAVVNSVPFEMRRAQ